jgi:hypothetical protein
LPCINNWEKIIINIISERITAENTIRNITSSRIIGKMNTPVRNETITTKKYPITLTISENRIENVFDPGVADDLILSILSPHLIDVINTTS